MAEIRDANMKKILTTVERRTQIRDRELLEAEEELEREERNVAEKDTFFKKEAEEAPVAEKSKKMVMRDGSIKREPKADRFKDKPH